MHAAAPTTVRFIWTLPSIGNRGGAPFQDAKRRNGRRGIGEFRRRKCVEVAGRTGRREGENGTGDETAPPDSLPHSRRVVELT